MLEHQLKNPIETSLTSKCLELKILPLKHFFEFLKNLNSIDTSEDECARNLTSSDLAIKKRVEKLRNESNFPNCSKELFSFLETKEYLFVYVKNSEENLNELRRNYLRILRSFEQETLDCILEVVKGKKI